MAEASKHSVSNVTECTRSRRNILRRLQTVSEARRIADCAEAEGDLHSASTRGFSFTKDGNVPAVREETSEAEVTAAETRPSAKVVRVRMLAVFEVNGPVIEVLGPYVLRSFKRTNIVVGVRE